MVIQLKDFATSPVVVVEVETTALTVAQLMRKHHVGAVVVVDSPKTRRPVGIVTDRDLVLELMAEGLDPAVFTAGDIMSINPILASPSIDALDAVQLMNTHRLRRLPIADDSGQLVGIVTMDDLIELLARELGSLAAGGIGARDREITQRG